MLDLLGKAHAMAILSAFAFADEPLRFSELEERLEVPANTLSERLKEIVAAGLLGEKPTTRFRHGSSTNRPRRAERRSRRSATCTRGPSSTTSSPSKSDERR
ncbi:MarR family transcriptional regulator [Natrinema halophilum]|nr:helix-turn-helix domain-containing protein [Natrinema halophilum]UHQ96032.1 MarR family transcriptional regulator [Natrinema halophilum]